MTIPEQLQDIIDGFTQGVEDSCTDDSSELVNTLESVVEHVQHTATHSSTLLTGDMFSRFNRAWIVGVIVGLGNITEVTK